MTFTHQCANALASDSSCETMGPGPVPSDVSDSVSRAPSTLPQLFEYQPLGAFAALSEASWIHQCLRTNYPQSRAVPRAVSGDSLPSDHIHNSSNNPMNPDLICSPKTPAEAAAIVAGYLPMWSVSLVELDTSSQNAEAVLVTSVATAGEGGGTPVVAEQYVGLRCNNLRVDILCVSIGTVRLTAANPSWLTEMPLPYCSRDGDKESLRQLYGKLGAIHAAVRDEVKPPRIHLSLCHDISPALLHSCPESLPGEIVFTPIQFATLDGSGRVQSRHVVSVFRQVGGKVLYLHDPTTNNWSFSPEGNYLCIHLEHLCGEHGFTFRRNPPLSLMGCNFAGFTAQSGLGCTFVCENLFLTFALLSSCDRRSRVVTNQEVTAQFNPDSSECQLKDRVVHLLLQLKDFTIQDIMNDPTLNVDAAAAFQAQVDQHEDDADDPEGIEFYQGTTIPEGAAPITQLPKRCPICSMRVPEELQATHEMLHCTQLQVLMTQYEQWWRQKHPSRVATGNNTAASSMTSLLFEDEQETVEFCERCDMPCSDLFQEFHDCRPEDYFPFPTFEAFKMRLMAPPPRDVETFHPFPLGFVVSRVVSISPEPGTQGGAASPEVTPVGNLHQPNGELDGVQPRTSSSSTCISRRGSPAPGNAFDCDLGLSSGVDSSDPTDFNGSSGIEVDDATSVCSPKGTMHPTPTLGGSPRPMGTLLDVLTQDSVLVLKPTPSMDAMGVDPLAVSDSSPSTIPRLQDTVADVVEPNECIAGAFAPVGGSGRSDPSAVRHLERYVVHCCGNLDTSPVPAREAYLQDLKVKLLQDQQPKTDLNPKSKVGLGDCWYKLGLYLSTSSDPDEATVELDGATTVRERDCFVNAVELLGEDPNAAARAWCALASVVKVGDTQYSPWNCVNRALELVDGNVGAIDNPKWHAELWYMLGCIFDPKAVPCAAAVKRKVTNPQQCFLHALQIDENYAPAWQSLGCSLGNEFAIASRGGITVQQKQCFERSFAALDARLLRAAPQWLSMWYYNLGVSLVSGHPTWSPASMGDIALHHIEAQIAEVRFAGRGSQVTSLTKADCYRMAVEIDQSNYRAWYALGYASKPGEEFNVGGLEDMDRLTCFTKALYLCPTYSPAWNNAGLSADKGTENGFVRIEGEKYKKQRCYLKAIACDSKNKDAFVNLGNTLADGDTVIVQLGNTRPTLTKKECFDRGDEWSNVAICRWNEILAQRAAKTYNGTVDAEANEEREVLEYFSRGTENKPFSVKSWKNYAVFLDSCLSSQALHDDAELANFTKLRDQAQKRVESLEVYYHKDEPFYSRINSTWLINRSTLSDKTRRSQLSKKTETALYYNDVGAAGTSVGYKEFLDECRQRIEEELQRMKRLVHGNIVPTLSMVQDPDNNKILGFTFESMEEGTLEKEIRTAQPSTIANWLICVASALTYAHRQDMIHGHLHMGAIRIKDNHAKISHFGTGKMQYVLEWDMSRRRHWSANESVCGVVAPSNSPVKGWEGFPPDFHHSTEFTQAMDAYTFGRIVAQLWELGLFKKLQFPGGDMSGVSTSSVCQRLLSDEPEERPTMSEVLVELRDRLMDYEKISALSAHPGVSQVRGRFDRERRSLMKEIQFAPFKSTQGEEWSELLKFRHPRLLCIEDIEANALCGQVQVLMNAGHGDAKYFFTNYQEFDKVPGLFERYLKKFIRQVLQALQYIHLSKPTRGTAGVHGDLTPESVMYTASQSPAKTSSRLPARTPLYHEASAFPTPTPELLVDFKLADFDAVRAPKAQDDSSNTVLAPHGTKDYLAPECRRETAEQWPPRAGRDVWALGCSVLTLHSYPPQKEGKTMSTAGGGPEGSIVNVEGVVVTMPRNLSSDCKIFLEGIFVPEAVRPTVDELLAHSYLSSVPQV